MTEYDYNIGTMSACMKGDQKDCTVLEQINQRSRQMKIPNIHGMGAASRIELDCLFASQV